MILRSQKFTKKVKTYKLNVEEYIGHGTFGVVYKGKDRAHDDRPVAAKEINAKIHPRVWSQNFEKLLHLRNENVLEIFDIDRDEEKGVVWFIMEFCPHGDLNSFFRKHNPAMDSRLKIIHGISSGVAFLHDKGIIHRDVKPGNILVASQDPLVVKLADFDLIKCLDEDYLTSAMSTNVGTLEFKAPEFFRRPKPTEKLKYHRTVDIFAGGLTYLAIIQHKEGQMWLIPRIETLQDHPDAFEPIGRLMWERENYNGPCVDIVDLQTECSPEIRRAKRLICDMTKADPNCRPKACVVKQRCEVKKRYCAA